MREYGCVCADEFSGVRCLCPVEVTETSRAGMSCTRRVTHCRMHSMAYTKDPSMLHGACIHGLQDKSYGIVDSEIRR